MKVYSPYDAEKVVPVHGMTVTLAPNAVTELSDEQGAHVVRKLAGQGVCQVTGDPAKDADVIAAAEEMHTAYLKGQGIAHGLIKPEPSGLSTRATELLPSLKKRGLI